ncbi:glycosyltransferase family 2 protein [Vibrio cholerae]|nr:glycosyltransferase family 2 protein [Vibrio cholerae]ELI0377508.1 glycosyltransferase family 2 protein [Vibrio cholerae]
MPIVSVILCVFNAEKYLLDALNSIRNQTYKKIELVIVNDGSTDSSVDIIKGFISSTSIKVIYHEQENMGLTASLNIAVSLSSGEYIARMDADDISMPDRIEKSLTYLQSNEFDFICTMASTFNDSQEVIRKIPQSKILINFLLNDAVLKYGNPTIHGTYFAKREVFENIKYNIKYRTAQDYDFICNLVSGNKYICGYLPEILYRLRIDENSSGRIKGGTQLNNAIDICRKYYQTADYLIPAAQGLNKLYLSIRKRLELCVVAIFSKN